MSMSDCKGCIAGIEYISYESREPEDILLRLICDVDLLKRGEERRPRMKLARAANKT